MRKRSRSGHCPGLSRTRRRAGSGCNHRPIHWKIRKGEKVREGLVDLTAKRGAVEILEDLRASTVARERFSLPAGTGKQVEFARTYDRYWPIGQAKYSEKKNGHHQKVRASMSVKIGT